MLFAVLAVVVDPAVPHRRQRNHDLDPHGPAHRRLAEELAAGDWDYEQILTRITHRVSEHIADDVAASALACLGATPVLLAAGWEDRLDLGAWKFRPLR